MRQEYLNIINKEFNAKFEITETDLSMIWNKAIKNLQDCSIKLWPKSKFWFDFDGNFYFQIMEGQLWCSHKNVWNIFKREINVPKSILGDFIKNQFMITFNQAIDDKLMIIHEGGDIREEFYKKYVL